MVGRQTGAGALALYKLPLVGVRMPGLAPRVARSQLAGGFSKAMVGLSFMGCGVACPGTARATILSNTHLCLEYTDHVGIYVLLATLSTLPCALQTSTFILAGTETTANSLSFTVYLLTQNPEAGETSIDV